MMLIPAILPDEFVFGYRGRIRILNNYRDAEATSDALIRHFQKENPGHEKPKPVTTLAYAANINTDCLLHQHTLRPFIYAIERVRLGQTANDSMGKDSISSGTSEALRLRAGKARYCPCCVLEDIDFWGIPYWRRSHQIHGVDWCTKHGVILEFQDNTQSYDSPPPLRNSTRSLAQVKDLHGSEGQALRRYADIAYAMLELRRPLKGLSLGRILTCRTQERGLRISVTGKRPLISDLAMETMPQEWLSTHFPDLANKRPYKYVPSIDGVCHPIGPKFYATPKFVLAATLLFEGADEALRALTETTDFSHPKKYKKTSLRRSLGRERQLEAAYIASNGNHNKASSIVGTHPTSIGQILRQVGLPSLTGVDDATRQAFINFHNGLPLDQMPPRVKEQVLTLLRAASAPLFRALTAIASQNSGLDSHATSPALTPVNCIQKRSSRGSKSS